MTTITETPRLRLRTFSLDDAETYYRQIRSDPEVTRYLLSGTRESVDATARLLERFMSEYGQRGFGIWAVEEKATGALIGHAGLHKMGDADDIEVAYAFTRSAWGKGYATEAGRACLDYGFTTAQLPIIYGVAVPDNMASRSVLLKLGMTFEGIVDRYYNATLACYWKRRDGDV